MIALIAAYANNRIIGCHGRIPWNIPGERARFRELTTGNVVVMGRRTYEEIGRPLPNRETILISSSLTINEEHCTTVRSLHDALVTAGERDVYIAGGEQLYREALPLADVLYLTEIDMDVAGDRYFPDISPADFVLTGERQMYGSISYRYLTFHRVQMTYEQARSYVQHIAAESGIVPGLQPLRELLARLGNPQNQTTYLHIAGTNGKGSVGAMLYSILRRAGYHVGRFASPAVFDPLECWTIDNRTIRPEEYAAGMTRLMLHRAAMLHEGQPVPTAFELETALAFLWFAENHCELAVLECGMGGLEDATNVVTTTAVSLFTAIGLDHTAFLGDTLEKIAAQKSGIIKPGIPAVIQAQSKIVEQIIVARCQAQKSQIHLTKPEQVCLPPGGGTSFVYQGQHWHTALTGSCQADNAAQVLGTIPLLRERGYAISEKDIRYGLETVVCPGRFETVHTRPRVILDGAHNPNAARRLRETLDTCIPQQMRLILILGVLRDKDYTEVAALLAPRAQCVYTITPNSPRALPAQQLAVAVQPFCQQVQPVTLEQAVGAAMEQAGADGVVLAAGSLSYLGELRRVLRTLIEGHAQ